MTKASELRNLSTQELRDKENALKKSLFDLVTQRSTGRVEKPSRIRQAKKDIARILTIIREKKWRKDTPAGKESV